MATAAQRSYKPAIYREQGGNILRFRDTSALFGVPECLLWGDAPVLQCLADPSLGSYLFEDFLRAPSDTTVTGFETIDDSGTGTCTYQDVAHGVFNVVTAASDNDYHAFASVNEVFNLGLQKKLWFEARFKLAYGAAAEAAWWFGLTDTTTTGGLQANAAGPLADYDGALMWKDEDGTVLNFEVSNATEMTAAQVETVKKHLALVFVHDIDPSMGDKSHQDKLNAVHNGGPFDVVMRC